MRVTAVPRGSAAFVWPLLLPAACLGSFAWLFLLPFSGATSQPLEAAQYRPPRPPLAGPHFTDASLQASATTIRAVHIAELRARIDQLRWIAGLPAMSWTDPTLSVGVTLARALHVTEMRAALNEVYVARGQSAPAYTDPQLAANSMIRAVYISELRNAVIGLE